MAKFELRNKAATSRAALKAPGLPAAVSAAAETMAARARTLTDDEIVVARRQNRDRPAAYITRLGSGAAGEAEDRALGRSIGGA